MKVDVSIVNHVVILVVVNMITGFEEAMDSFIDRELQLTEYEELIYPLEVEAAKIYKRYHDAIYEYSRTLPPEAFQGYGGQTPQYDYELPSMSEKDKKRLEEIKITIKKLREKFDLE